MEGGWGNGVVNLKIFDSMSYLVANIPPVEVLIDKRFLYDFQTDDAGKVTGIS